jgi:DnaJ-class molecular chaperone
MGKVKGLFMDKQEAMIDCPECDGTGDCEYEREVPMSNSNPEGYLEDYWAKCVNCGGTGIIERDDDAELDAALDAYEAELKKIQGENSDDI